MNEWLSFSVSSAPEAIYQSAVPYIPLLAPGRAAVQIPTSRIDFDLAPLTALFFSGFLLILLIPPALHSGSFWPIFTIAGNFHSIRKKLFSIKREAFFFQLTSSFFLLACEFQTIVKFIKTTTVCLPLLPWSLGECTSAIGLHLLIYRRLVFSSVSMR